ncbi:MAG TPA: 30S ribosomal protein S7 [bacterium]|nr:30S ribosomal protein S7 [bacterium]HQO34931.1 30S ribosomal protein S7 [bacterium]HQQ00297.1 30S ribosomal protein S7 [bacterium]
MGRKKKTIERDIVPDARFGSKLVAKFVNNLMFRGNKSVAEQLFYKAMEQVEKKTGQDPLTVFKNAVENVKPTLEVRSRRVGGATYQVPVEVRPNRRQALAFRWLIAAARGRSERGMAFKLAQELIDAANNQGTSIKKKQDTHRMAEANKAFAHYRW